MRAVIAPLTDKHRADIESALAKLKDVQAQINRAQAAGVDMSGHQRQHDKHLSQLTGFLKHYFPPAE